MTTTTLSDLPGRLDIEHGAGSTFSKLATWSIALTGYTFECKVDATDVTVTNTNLAAGQITLLLTSAQITTLGIGKHSWYLTWTVGGVSTRVLAGDFTIKEKA